MFLQTGEQQHGRSQCLQRGEFSRRGARPQDRNFQIRKQQLCRQVQVVAPLQRHHHDPPSDDGVNRDGPFQTFGGVVLDADDDDVSPLPSEAEVSIVPRPAGLVAGGPSGATRVRSGKCIGPHSILRAV